LLSNELINLTQKYNDLIGKYDNLVEESDVFSERYYKLSEEYTKSLQEYNIRLNNFNQLFSRYEQLDNKYSELLEDFKELETYKKFLVKNNQVQDLYDEKNLAYLNMVYTAIVLTFVCIILIIFSIKEKRKTVKNKN